MSRLPSSQPREDRSRFPRVAQSYAYRLATQSRLPTQHLSPCPRRRLVRPPPLQTSLRCRKNCRTVRRPRVQRRRRYPRRGRLVPGQRSWRMARRSSFLHRHFSRRALAYRDCRLSFAKLGLSTNWRGAPAQLKTELGLDSLVSSEGLRLNCNPELLAGLETPRND
jgi:hypothetical protein